MSPGVRIVLYLPQKCFLVVSIPFSVFHDLLFDLNSFLYGAKATWTSLEKTCISVWPSGPRVSCHLLVAILLLLIRNALVRIPRMFMHFLQVNEK